MTESPVLAAQAVRVLVQGQHGNLHGVDAPALGVEAVALHQMPGDHFGAAQGGDDAEAGSHPGG